MRSENDYENEIESRLPAKTDADLLALIGLIDEAIENHATSKSLLRWRANAECALTRGDVNEAKEFLDRAFALDPNDPETLSDLGYWHDVWCDDETKIAFRYFAEAVRRLGDAEAWYGLIRCALQLGRVTLATQLVTRLETLYPGDRWTIDSRRELDAGLWLP